MDIEEQGYKLYPKRNQQNKYYNHMNNIEQEMFIVRQSKSLLEEIKLLFKRLMKKLSNNYLFIRCYAFRFMIECILGLQIKLIPVYYLSIILHCFIFIFLLYSIKC